jgi:NAD(P)-dependent dehydrogenase (short-subunit alcohol dehydrogenase family)
VTEPEVPGRVVEQILEVYGRVDILVNNVGGSFGVTLEDADETTIEKNLRSNLISALIFTKMVVPAMISQRQGAVVFVSSINALLGGFSEIAYSAAKAGLHAAARGLTADYGPYGIRFNVVCPGSVPREGGAWARREQESPGTIDRLNRIYPLGRFGTPKDVAHGILYLASDEAAWVSGVVLPIDGGLTATGRLPGGHWWENI